MSIEIKLPELGENIESGTVVTILISVGDVLVKEQPLLELETDKAVVEMPVDQAGKVEKILVKEGDEVKVGQTVIILETDSSTPAQKAEAITDNPVVETSKPIPKPVKQTDSTSIIEFKIPELGENIESGTVVTILVKEGEQIAKDTPLFELETDKAVVEVPFDGEGTIQKIMVKEGDTVSVGQTVLTVMGKSEKPETAAAEQSQSAEVLQTKIKPEMKPSAAGKPATAVFEVKHNLVPAAPSVRRFAREIGIDINKVSGSGPSGRISIDDVKNHSRNVKIQPVSGGTAFPGIEIETLPDFSKWGEIDRSPMGNVRMKTAKHLSYAWVTIPHVTQFDKADITELEKLRKQYAFKAEAAGTKLTMTALLLNIVTAALKIFPQFNASIDMENKEIIYKKYYHIGVAVDTERGLLVPVIRDTDQKNSIELSIELNQMAEKARSRKLTLEEMQGGTFTISNLGGIGGTSFTPVVNAPEVAILGVSRSRIEPVFEDGKFEPRSLLPLSLSYDHRIIDGADAARFLKWIVQAVEQPFLVMLEG